MSFEKLIRDGMVAVVHSHGWSGWHTYNLEHEGLVFDREIAELVIAGDNDGALAVASRKYPGAYVDRQELTVTWVPQGSDFEIEEYDGCESVHVIGSRKYLKA